MTGDRFANKCIHCKNFQEVASYYGCSATMCVFENAADVYKQCPLKKTLLRVRCIVEAVNLRLGDSVLTSVMGRIRKGEVIDVYEASDGWYRTTNGFWCHSRYFLQEISIESVTVIHDW